MKALVEGGSAHLDVCVPPTGGIFRGGGYREGVESVLTGRHHPCIELAFRCIELQGSRMAFRDALHLVGQDHAHVQCVAGAPHAAFAIYESLETLLNCLSSYVEAAE